MGLLAGQLLYQGRVGVGGQGPLVLVNNVARSGPGRFADMLAQGIINWHVSALPGLTEIGGKGGCLFQSCGRNLTAFGADNYMGARYIFGV